MLPVIGVTASVSDDRLSFQQKRMYCEAISACGGLPLILPPQEDVSRASQVLSLLDGLLLAGTTLIRRITTKRRCRNAG